MMRSFSIEDRERVVGAKVDVRGDLPVNVTFLIFDCEAE
jgi:hypothetical protein